MAINVNRVAVGFNCKNYDTAYFTRVAKVCPVSSTAQQDGSFLICKSGGLAWFVSPASTQISSAWANGQYNNVDSGDKCCISEWGVLGNCLSALRYVPTEWFVPSVDLLVNPFFECRGCWGGTTVGNPSYWSSTQCGSYTCRACRIVFQFPSGSPTSYLLKCIALSVRAIRCVTY